MDEDKGVRLKRLSSQTFSNTEQRSSLKSEHGWKRDGSCRRSYRDPPTHSRPMDNKSSFYDLMRDVDTSGSVSSPHFRGLRRTPSLGYRARDHRRRSYDGRAVVKDSMLMGSNGYIKSPAGDQRPGQCGLPCIVVDRSLDDRCQDLTTEKDRLIQNNEPGSDKLIKQQSLDLPLGCMGESGRCLQMDNFPCGGQRAPPSEHCM